jgi:mRNA-degrading endonuclease RelE of RelBE toxin-antitoxin system
VPFRLVYHPSVKDEDLPGIPAKTRTRIMRALEERIGVQPARFGKPLRGTLLGLWSRRVGDYRIVYAIRREEVWVLRIWHRREVYKRVEARMRLLEESSDAEG